MEEKKWIHIEVKAFFAKPLLELAGTTIRTSNLTVLEKGLIQANHIKY